MPLLTVNNGYSTRFYQFGNKFFFLQSPWRRSFMVTLVFVMLSSLLFWSDAFRIYQSEVQIMVVGKSSNVATEQVAENFVELSRNLSFYERVLKSDDLIDDDFEGYPKDQRKALWNQAVVVKQRAGSSILVVTARQDTVEKAKRLSVQTAQTLFAVAGFYYDIKADIDMRIIDEPIVKPVIGHPVRYILTSVGSAFGVTIVFFLILSLAPSLFGTRRKKFPLNGTPQIDEQATLHEKTHQDFAIGSAVPFIDPRKFLPTRPKALSYELPSEEEVIRQEIIAPVATSAAPDNLPGMDVFELPFQFEAPVIDMSFPAEQETIKTELPITPVSEKLEKPGEPTIEEYKRRLNELLAGGK